MNYFLGIDIGTTHTKAVIITNDGKPFFEAKKGYDLLHPQPGYEEQDASLIMEAVSDVTRQAIAAVTSGDIVAASFSAAMHSILPVDDQGKPLYNSVIWADTRSKQEADEIRRHPDADAIYATTGIPFHPMSPFCKILWFKKNRPDLFAKTARFVSIKEFVCFNLFGKYIVDYSIAAATGLFNIYEQKWEAKALQVAGIDESKLSQPVSTLHAELELLPYYSDLFKLKDNIPFVIGASDGCLANLGSGVVNHGEVALTIGTSGAARMTVKMTQGIPKGIAATDNLFTYPLAGDLYVRGGAINNGGIILQWLAGLFLDTDKTDYEELLDLAKPIAPGANGLIFLPYLLGERAPVWDADAKGAMIGLTLNHKRGHIIRAAMEGIGFTLSQIIKKLEGTYGNVEDIYVSGGFVRSSFWVQLIADITGKRINVSDMADASAIGAAYLAMHATSYIKDLAEVKRFIRISQTYQPDGKNHEKYKELFKLFESLYPKLKDDFANLGHL